MILDRLSKDEKKIIKDGVKAGLHPRDIELPGRALKTKRKYARRFGWKSKHRWSRAEKSELRKAFKEGKTIGEIKIPGRDIKREAISIKLADMGLRKKNSGSKDDWDPADVAILLDHLKANPTLTGKIAYAQLNGKFSRAYSRMAVTKKLARLREAERDRCEAEKIKPPQWAMPPGVILPSQRETMKTVIGENMKLFGHQLVVLLAAQEIYVSGATARRMRQDIADERAGKGTPKKSEPVAPAAVAPPNPAASKSAPAPVAAKKAAKPAPKKAADKPAAAASTAKAEKDPAGSAPPAQLTAPPAARPAAPTKPAVRHIPQTVFRTDAQMKEREAYVYHGTPLDKLLPNVSMNLRDAMRTYGSYYPDQAFVDVFGVQKGLVSYARTEAKVEYIEDRNARLRKYDQKPWAAYSRWRKDNAGR